MIILYRPDSDSIVPRYQPVVIADYTRSDEQWSESQISKYVNSFRPKGSVLSKTVVYSLDFQMTYTHRGIQYGDSLKTEFIATIRNAPIVLVNLLNIQQYTSQQNIDALTKVVNAVIDPQVKFPTGGFVIRGPVKANGTYDIITRTFIVYSSPSEYDQRTRNSTLILRGAAFNSMVMKLKFAANINKTQPIITQIKSLLSKYNYTVIAGTVPLNDRKATVAKYYSPAPIDDILSEICLDNNMGFYQAGDVYIFQDFSPKGAPQQTVKAKFSFANYVPNTNVMTTFKPDNYSGATFEGEAYDATLFTSVAVYDDSFSQGVDSNGTVSPGLFSTYVKTPQLQYGKIGAYRFYILMYSYFDSRDKTSIIVTATNNWLISMTKIDNLLENAIYKNQLGKS